MTDGICAVVGVGPGIGMAVASRFGAEGYKIVLMARSKDKLTSYAAELERDGIQSNSYPLDAGNFNAIRTVFKQAQSELGPMDVLIYNAANYNPGKPSALTPESVTEAFRVTVVGALACAQAVLPSMRERQSGTILLTGGGLALHPAADYASLSIGKAGLRSLAYSMGQELILEGIQVATVTIAGTVKEGTHFDPTLIANVYWQLHTDNRNKREIIYD